MGTIPYLRERLWRLHEVWCLQHLELHLAYICPINTTIIIILNAICRVTTSLCEDILYIGCQMVISGIVSSFLGSAMDRLLVISAFSVSGQAEVFHVTPSVSCSNLPCAEFRQSDQTLLTNNQNWAIVSSKESEHSENILSIHNNPMERSLQINFKN